MYCTTGILFNNRMIDFFIKEKISLPAILLILLLYSFSSLACSPSPPPQYKEKEGAIYFYATPGNKNPTLVTYDLKHFKGINALYGIDKDHVYYMGKKISQANPDSFEFLGGVNGLITVDGYSKDRAHVYFNGKIIANALPQGFTVFSDDVFFYGVDLDSIFIDGKKVAMANPATVKNIKKGYWSDGKSLYYVNQVGDETSLTLIDTIFDGFYKHYDNYFVSHRAVYQAGKKMPYDPETFNVLATEDAGNTCYTNIVAALITDKDGTYLNDKKVAPPMQNTLYSGVFTDKKGVLYIFSRDSRLKTLGNKNQFSFISVQGKTLIQGDSKFWLLDEYDLRDVPELNHLSKDSKLHVYSSLEGMLILSDGSRLYNFDGALSILEEKMPRLVYFDSEMAVFETQSKTVLNVDHNGVSEFNPIKNNDSPGIRYVKYNQYLAKLVSKRVTLSPGQGVFLVKNYIVYSDGSPMMPLSDEEYNQLLAYTVPDAEWEKIRSHSVSQYLSAGAG
ncbi:TPA: DKNYY domain-containing protein [Citrobacter braakii]